MAVVKHALKDRFDRNQLKAVPPLGWKVLTSESCGFEYLVSNEGTTEFVWSTVMPEDPPLLPAAQPEIPRVLRQAPPAKDGVAPYIVQHSQGTRCTLVHMCKPA